MKKAKVVAVWLLFLLLGLVVCWPLLTATDLNLKYDWGFSLFSWNKTWHDATSAWGDFFLGQAVGINTAWLPLLLLSGFGLLTNIPVLLTLKLLVVAVITLGGVGMTWLLKNRGVPLSAAIFGGIWYALSPLLFIRVVVGFIFYLLAIAIVPWLLRGWFITVEQRVRVWWAYLVPVLFAILTAQPQFTIMVLIIMLLDLVSAPNINYFKRAFGLILLSIFSALVLQLPWLIVVLRQGVSAATNINNLGSSLATIAALPHSIIRTLIGADHHITFFYFDHLLSSHWFVLGTFGTVVLAVLAPALAGRKREVKLMSVILALGWILALGTAEPTGKVYGWLYQHLPFTNLFREVYHWEFLITLALSVLAAVTLGFWLQKSRRSWPIILVAVIILIGYATPYWRGGWRDLIGPATVPASYRLITASHDSEVDHTTRSLFLPPLGFIKFKADNTPGATNNDIYALSTDRAQLPADASILDLPSAPLSLRSAVIMSLYAQDPYLAGFLRSVSVNNIYVRTDLESEFPALFRIPRENNYFAKRWYDVDYDQLLRNQLGIEPLNQQPGVHSWLVNDTPTLISLANRPVTAAFDWRSLAQSDGDAVFYLEDLDVADVDKVKGLVYVGTPEDRLAAANQGANILGASNYQISDNVQDGWMRPNGSWWVASSLAYAKEPYLFTTNGEQAGPVTFSVNASTEKQPVVLLKYWSGQGASTISVYYGDELYETINSHSDDTEGNWVWRHLTLPTTTQTTNLKITGTGYTGLAQLIIEAGEPLPLEPHAVSPERKSDQDVVVFTKKTNSLYEVKTDLQEPRWLIFRMTYDADWQLINGNVATAPTRVNGYAMAWQLPAGNGDYILRFGPATAYTGWQVLASGYLLVMLYLSWRLRRKEPI